MLKKIIRVFPRKTSYTPNDDMVFIGDPTIFMPDADEVHISCLFTWDIGEVNRLYLAWKQYYDIVKIGGPAIPLDNHIGEFVPGRYVKSGVTFTSRGCNNNCPWCFVRPREGKLKELPITEGYIIQDNNFLQCNRSHIAKVFDMLKTQSRILFTGGLDPALITLEIVASLKALKIDQIFTACDNKESVPKILKAGELLKDLPVNMKRCYVMIGYNGETLSDATDRIQAVCYAGFLPFVQLYKPIGPVEYSQEWEDLQRNYSRPAITKSLIKVRTR